MSIEKHTSTSYPFSSLGFSTVGESRKILESKVSTILVVPIFSPQTNSFLLGFHVLATSTVIRTGFEPTNCCHMYLASLVFCLKLHSPMAFESLHYFEINITDTLL